MAAVHVFNIDLVKEYFSTCGEYFALVKKPFQTIPFKKIWGCNQSNWEDAFRTWGAFQVWLAGIIITLSNLIVIISFPEYIGTAIFNIIYGIATAYLFAHLGWFSVTKKDGCCCCFVVCFTGGKVFILLWGLWCVLWGLQTIMSGLTYLGYGGAAAIAGILYIIYAIAWVYMGVCLIRVWQAKGSDVVPAKIDAVVVGEKQAEAPKQQEQPKQAEQP